MKLYRPVVLVVLDGWGVAPPGPGNAILLARTPNYDRFMDQFRQLPCPLTARCGTALRPDGRLEWATFAWAPAASYIRI